MTGTVLSGVCGTAGVVVAVSGVVEATASVHAPAIEAIAPFCIFKQYGSFVTSSYNVIPVGFSTDPTVNLSVKIFLK